MATERDLLQAWIEQHDGDRVDAALANKIPPCEGWYPIVDDYLRLTGELAAADDTQYRLVSDALGCVQLYAERRYLLSARYVNMDLPLRLYLSLPEACAVAMDLEGDYFKLCRLFSETVSAFYAMDFCGFEVLLVHPDGRVGLAVETFGREPDAI